MQIHYGIKFLITFVLLMCFAFGMGIRANGFNQTFVDFAGMSPTEVFVEHGLTRSQIGSIKLRSQAKLIPPQIGFFGNHTFQFFNQRAFHRNGIEKVFFNYWFGNISFTEVLIILEHLERLEKLPTEHIIVGVTSPTNNNGRYILGHYGEMPDWILDDVTAHKKIGSAQKNAPTAWMETLRMKVKWVKRTFDYASFLNGVFTNYNFDRVIDLSICQDQNARSVLLGLVERIPVTIRNMLTSFGVPNTHCNPLQWKETLKSDGARNEKYVRKNPTIDQKPFDPARYDLGPGDAQNIDSTIREIVALAERNKREITIVVQPVFESERYLGNPMNNIFSEGISKLTDIRLLDDRGLRNRQELFTDYDHLGSAYYTNLVNRIFSK